MPFIPHTAADISTMLSAMGVNAVADLFDEIPKALASTDISALPEGVSEMALAREIGLLAQRDPITLNFIGAGAYAHHIPAAVWDIASRGEFMTAYTPYQAEASQGGLQLLYEYQTMMANLMAMDSANSSNYDGATALAESIFMALRLRRKPGKKCIALPGNLHPHYRYVLNALLKYADVHIITVPYCAHTGALVTDVLDPIDNIAALVIAQPNFFGGIEAVDTLTDYAHEKGALVIGVVNPIAMALLKPPGDWGNQGADIVCGEGQPLGIPVASGGPYFGFLCCKTSYLRQMPGRIVGRGVDQRNQPCFTLTLQAREQHIRRGKATSNICTNQGLLVVAASVFMSLLGAEGLQRVALASHHNLVYLRDQLQKISGVTLLFKGPSFQEMVIALPCGVESLLDEMANVGIQAGVSLKPYFPDLKESLLICTTEIQTTAEIDYYVENMARIVQRGVT